MKRFYDITWYATKDRNPIERTNRIQIGKPRGVTSVDAKAAVDLFCREFGNLNKITIVCVKELDENLKQIGEDIVPTDEVGILPVKHK